MRNVWVHVEFLIADISVSYMNAVCGIEIFFSGEQSEKQETQAEVSICSRFYLIRKNSLY